MVAINTTTLEGPRVYSVLTDRWTILRPHRVQRALWDSFCRFAVVPAGRRSGKTEIAKRKIINKAMTFTDHPDGWFVLAAPTHDQATRIFWADLKRMVPDWVIAGISETWRTITLINGAEISVIGMDKPERIEGRPLDGIVLDEYANMKEIVWTQHVRPALSTPGRKPGWAWFIGVPEGRNHYHKLYKRARMDDSGVWEAFHWKSADILDPEEILLARHDLDRLTYEQEYEASFVNFEGRAYYDFDSETNATIRLKYNPNLPLVFCFDFNVKPGVAAICQEQLYRGKKLVSVEKKNPITAVIGEVWIPNNSNTKRVCNKLVADWKHHKGDILCYGDATGGARGTSQTEGSDWDIVRAILKPVFGLNLKMRYRRGNPKERIRVNAVNSRILSTDGIIRLLVDPVRASHVVDDFEGVSVIEGGDGEIDKNLDPDLTHISDAIGYYTERRFPIGSVGKVDSTEVV